MSQATKSPTTPRLHYASAGAVRQRPTPPANLRLPADMADAIAELCTLTTYAADGFTYTDRMMAACKAIADRSGPAAIAACLARDAERERAIIRR